MPEIRVFCDVPGHRLRVTQRPDGGLEIGLEPEPVPAAGILAARIETERLDAATKTPSAVFADELSRHTGDGPVSSDSLNKGGPDA